MCLFVVDAESVLYGVRGNQEIDLDELTFKLIVRPRDKPDPSSPYTITLMAPSAQEKAAWTSDISQVCKKRGMKLTQLHLEFICIDNKCQYLFHVSFYFILVFIYFLSAF